MKVLITLILASLCLVACDDATEQGRIEMVDQTVQESVVHEAELTPVSMLELTDERDGCYYQLLLLGVDGSKSIITDPWITCFEDHEKNDISPDGNFSLIHGLQKVWSKVGMSRSLLKHINAIFSTYTRRSYLKALPT